MQNMQYKRFYICLFHESMHINIAFKLLINNSLIVLTNGQANHAQEDFTYLPHSGLFFLPTYKRIYDTWACNLIRLGLVYINYFN